jgi:hypothetical protein
MPMSDEEIKQGVRENVPPLPFFARLLDPRKVLDPVLLMRYPELASNRLFTVVHAQFDRDAEHPGLWYRPLLTARNQKPAPAAFWLPASECVIDERFPVN